MCFCTKSCSAAATTLIFTARTLSDIHYALLCTSAQNADILSQTVLIMISIFVDLNGKRCYNISENKENIPNGAEMCFIYGSFTHRKLLFVI